MKIYQVLWRSIHPVKIDTLPETIMKVEKPPRPSERVTTSGHAIHFHHATRSRECLRLLDSETHPGHLQASLSKQVDGQDWLTGTHPKHDQRTVRKGKEHVWAAWNGSRLSTCCSEKRVWYARPESLWICCNKFFLWKPISKQMFQYDPICRRCLGHPKNFAYSDIFSMFKI